jgi:hypothetical protein
MEFVADLAILQPTCELFQPGLVVGEAFGPRAVADKKRRVEVSFAHVDSEKGTHGNETLREENDSLRPS